MVNTPWVRNLPYSSCKVCVNYVDGGSLDDSRGSTFLPRSPGPSGSVLPRYDLWFREDWKLRSRDYGVTRRTLLVVVVEVSWGGWGWFPLSLWRTPVQSVSGTWRFSVPIVFFLVVSFRNLVDHYLFISHQNFDLYLYSFLLQKHNDTHSTVTVVFRCVRLLWCYMSECTLCLKFRLSLVESTRMVNKGHSRNHPRVHLIL